MGFQQTIGVMILFCAAMWYFVLNPVVTELTKEYNEELKNENECYSNNGIVIKNFSDKKLYCIDKNIKIIQNDLNGVIAK